MPMSSQEGDATMAKMTKMDKVATWEMVGQGADTKKIGDALTKVGLDFGVEKRAIFFGPNMKKIADKYATVRTDKEEEMGIVGKGYEICPNDKAFAFADYIDDKMTFTRGGLTYSGLCWVMGELPPIKILGEDYTPCLCLQNSFNGKYCLRANIVALHNATGSQVNMALNGVASTIKVKHSVNLPSKMRQGQEALAAVTEYMDGVRKVAEKYANVKMNKDQIDMFMRILFPIRPNMSEQAKANVLANRDMFMACYDDDGNKTNRGNAWGLIRAYADYATHTIGKDTKTKYERKFMESTLGNGKNFTSFIKKLNEVTGTKIG